MFEQAIKLYAQAVDYARLAIERKPDCEGAYNILRRALFSSDRSEEAAALIDRALEANGDDYNTYIPYLNVLGRLQRADERNALVRRMVVALEKQLEIVPEDVRARILLAGQYAEADRGEDAIRQLQTAVALRPGDSNVPYNASCVYCLLGKKVEGLEALRRAFANGYSNREWAARDPDLTILKDEPEYQRLCGIDARTLRAGHRAHPRIVALIAPPKWRRSVHQFTIGLILLSFENQVANSSAPSCQTMSSGARPWQRARPPCSPWRWWKAHKSRRFASSSPPCCDR